MKNNFIMIIFNHNNVNNIELIVNREINIEKNTSYLYSLINKISITGIYDIYNNNDVDIYITIFIVKKPFWYS